MIMEVHGRIDGHFILERGGEKKYNFVSRLTSFALSPL
jgi:hypothetical protein